MLEVKQTIFYNITIDQETASELANAIDKVYKNFVVQGKIDDITPLLSLKDELVLAANKG